MLTVKKRRLSLKKIVARAVLCAVVGLSCYGLVTGPGAALWRKTAAMCRLECADIAFDSLYASGVREELTSLIKNYVEDSNFLSFDVKKLTQEVKKFCPLVHELSCIRTKPLSVVLHVRGTEPAFVINGSQVLAHDGALYDQSFFESYDLAQLKTATVEQAWCAAENTKCVYDYLMRIPAETWQNFAVAYRGPNAIEFCAYDEQGYLKTIMIDENKTLDNETMACINEVVADVVQKKMVARTQYQVACDARFEKRIFVKLLRRKNKGRRA
ncbi:hypothetical protein K2W90_00210 [Candidatus Babeliales bacterium]|nr:hypothetical protein [Candidatus Babeliales bacterium]